MIIKNHETTKAMYQLKESNFALFETIWCGFLEKKHLTKQFENYFMAMIYRECQKGGVENGE
jgi:hypothetical protein